MNDRVFRIYGCVVATIATGTVVWYFYHINKREQEAHEMTKRNTEYFMDRAKIQEMEQRFE